jgi:4-amino-4-deoxy-L-arabinose transferase-like glycosyltransferase
MAFRIFGESESVAHGLMLVILFATCLPLYLLVKSCCGTQAGLLSVFAWLVLPVTPKFGHLVYSPPLAILFILVAVLAFIKATATESIHRGWAIFGMTAQALAVLTIWEPLLLGVGLLAVAVWQRRNAQIHLALLYLAAGAVACCSLLVLYAVNVPYLVSDLWHTLLFRMGIAPFKQTEFHIHTVVQDSLYAIGQDPSWIRRIGVVTRRFALELIGPLATVAVGAILVVGWVHRRRTTNNAVWLLFGGLTAPSLLWFIIMPDHVYFHETEMSFAAPMAAAALALCVMTLIGLAEGEPTGSPLSILRWVALIVLPVVMLLPLNWEIKKRFEDRGPENPIITYSREIKENTEPGAVVMVPYDADEPLYYSNRHLIRGVTTDALVQDVLKRIHEVFRESPSVYLAVSPDAPPRRLSESLQRYPVIKKTPYLTLLAVSSLDTQPSPPGL